MRGTCGKCEMSFKYDDRCLPCREEAHNEELATVHAQLDRAVELLHEFNRDCEDGVCDKCKAREPFLAEVSK